MKQHDQKNESEQYTKSKWKCSILHCSGKKASLKKKSKKLLAVCLVRDGKIQEEQEKNEMKKRKTFHKLQAIGDNTYHRTHGTWYQQHQALNENHSFFSVCGIKWLFSMEIYFIFSSFVSILTWYILEWTMGLERRCHHWIFFPFYRIKI